MLESDYAYNKFYELIEEMDLDNYYTLDDFDYAEREPEVIEEVKTIPSLDAQKARELEIVLVAAAELEEDKEVEVPSYSRQQMVLSEVGAVFSSIYGLEDVIFPPVGAELMTEKVLSTITWSTINGVKAGKINLTLAHCAREVDETKEEAVVFSIKQNGKWRNLLWLGSKLRDTRCPIAELRWSSEGIFNYTNSYRDDQISPIPLTYPVLDEHKSYYIYVDGVPLYVPKAPVAILKVVDGKAMNNEGDEYFFVPECADGNYVFNLATTEPYRRTTRRADSRQMVQVMRASVVLTANILHRFDFLRVDKQKIEGNKGVINFNIGDPILCKVPQPDTTLSDMQIISFKYTDLDNRKKILHYLSKHLNYSLVNMMSSLYGVIVGNVVYQGFKVRVGNDRILYHGSLFMKKRSKGRIIVAAGNKPFFINGTWYEVIDET